MDDLVIVLLLVGNKKNVPHQEHSSSGTIPHREQKKMFLTRNIPHQEHSSSGTIPRQEHSPSGTFPREEHKK
jgi:hypothetical protein